MAGKKISELIPVDLLTGVELLPAVQSGVTKQVTAAELKTFATNELGTAAFEDVEAFATAAQGLLADTALQPETGVSSTTVATITSSATEPALKEIGDLWIDESTTPIQNYVDDVAYDVAWDGVGTQAPSKNAIYDKISSMYSDFATTAQGALADTAVQPGDAQDFIKTNLLANHTATEGEMTWNAAEQTLDIGLHSAVTLQVGQELHYHVVNETGSLITNGTLCMAAGTHGASGKLLVKPWDASGLSKYILGIATSDIPTVDVGVDGTGYVTAFGKVRGVQTNGANYGETWIAGDIIYAGGTSGLTKVLPSAPKTKTTVAMVINAHATNGTFFVRPTWGSQLGEDELVQLSNLAGGDVLVYNAVEGRFENATKSAAGIVTTSSNATVLGSGAATIGQILTANGSGGTSWSDSSGGTVHDTPVDGNTTAAISSNWAYDHAASTTAHDLANQIDLALTPINNALAAILG